MEIPFKGRPTPNIAWMKDRQPLKETTRLNVSSTATSTVLKIKEANREDSGKYTITATNNIGMVTEEVGIIILKQTRPTSRTSQNCVPPMLPCPGNHQYTQEVVR